MKIRFKPHKAKVIKDDIIKLIEQDLNESDDIETIRGLEFASEEGILSPREQGFMLGYLEA